MLRLMSVVGWMCLVVCFLCVPVVVSAQAGTLSATLTWANPSDITDQVQIEKANGPTGTFSVLKQLPANSTTYTDSTNNAGDNSCYRAAYFTSSGIGPYAGPVCKTFPALPTQAPTSFTVK